MFLMISSVELFIAVVLTKKFQSSFNELCLVEGSFIDEA